MTINEQNFNLPELTQNKQPLHIPQPRRHDWSQSVMRTCIHCDQWALTLHHEGFGGFMCASCFDAEYTADLKAMLVTALERLETAEKRIAELEESQAQVIHSRDHYKRTSEEGLQQLAESRTVTVKLLKDHVDDADLFGWGVVVVPLEALKEACADAGVTVEIADAGIKWEAE